MKSRIIGATVAALVLAATAVGAADATTARAGGPGTPVPGASRLVLANGQTTHGVARHAATSRTATTTAATTTAKKKKKPTKPKSTWHPLDHHVFFNNPYANNGDRYTIENELLSAIRHTPKTGHIRVSVYSFDRRNVAQALIAAHKRGVQVQVITNDHQVTAAQHMLYRALGRSPKKPNFMYECKESCRDGRDNMHSKFYLFSKTGGEPDDIYVGSDNFTLNAVKYQWNDLLSLPNDPAMFDHFVTVFNQMRHDYHSRQHYEVFCGKRIKGVPCSPLTANQYWRVFPRTSTSHNDPVLNILKPISCTYHQDGVLKRTKLTLTMHTMRGARGIYLANAVRRLYGKGCDVRVIYGLLARQTKDAIGRATARGRIPLRSAGFDRNHDGFVDHYTHQKNFTIDGMYNHKLAKLSFTGSSNWSEKGTAGDDNIFQIRGAKVLHQYLVEFNKMWRSNHYTRNSYTTTIEATKGGIDGRVMTTPSTPQLKPGGPHWEGD